jgi:putative ABC transport system permease protein
VLGFARREVGLMLLGEQGLLTVAAIPLGLVLGWVLCWLVVTRFTSDLFRIPLVISDLTRVTAVAVVLIAAVASGLVVWRRIRRLDLVAVLKTRE